MFLDLDGVRVYYEAEGEGDPVLLLHGWGANAGAMRPILSSLRSQDGPGGPPATGEAPVLSAGLRLGSPAGASGGAGHAVYALDFPGFGQSDLPSGAWGIGDYCQLVLRFLDANGLRRVDALGHSFGGRVGIGLAASHPDRVRKLVLVDSAGIRPALTAKRVLARGILQIGKAVLRAPGLGAVRARTERIARSRLGSADYQSAGPLRDTFVKVVSEDLRPLLPRIQAPTLLIWGELDQDTPVSDARIMEREIPDAGLVVLKGAGHFSYLDCPGDFARIVRTFLAQPSPPTT